VQNKEFVSKGDFHKACIVILLTGYGPRVRGIKKKEIMADTRFSITKLNNTNFQVWKCKVELLLIKEDLWHAINADRPTNPAMKGVFERINKRVLRLVY